MSPNIVTELKGIYRGIELNDFMDHPFPLFREVTWLLKTGNVTPTHGEKTTQKEGFEAWNVQSGFLEHAFSRMRR